MQNKWIFLLSFLNEILVCYILCTYWRLNVVSPLLCIKKPWRCFDSYGCCFPLCLLFIQTLELLINLVEYSKQNIATLVQLQSSPCLDSENTDSQGGQCSSIEALVKLFLIREEAARNTDEMTSGLSTEGECDNGLSIWLSKLGLVVLNGGSTCVLDSNKLYIYTDRRISYCDDGDGDIDDYNIKDDFYYCCLYLFTQ